MVNISSVPARTLPPVVHNYCFFTKQDFGDFTRRALEVVSGELNKAIELEIDVAGFDTPFQNAQDLTDNISNLEWLKLKSFSVRFVADKDTYHPVAEMKFGMSHAARGTDKPTPVGFVFTIKAGTTSQKVAIKEGINVLIADYKRRTMPVILYVLLGTILITAVSLVTYLILKKHFGFNWDQHAFNNTFVMSLIGGLIVSLVAVGYAFPVFETLESENKFHLKTTKQFISAFFVAYGLLLAVISLL